MKKTNPYRRHKYIVEALDDWFKTEQTLTKQQYQILKKTVWMVWARL